MTCPEAGLWRAWIDRELPDRTAGFADHLAACAACQTTVATLEANAAVAAGALAALGAGLPPLDAEEREHRAPLQPVGATAADQAPAPVPISSRHSPQETHPMTRILSGRRWRVALGGLAAALALTFAVATPQGRTATAQFLAQFRSQNFTVVTIDPRQGAGAFDHLEHLGTFNEGRPERPPMPVASFAEASQVVGFPVRQPDPAALPAGISATPESIEVVPGHTGRLTFDAAKTNSYFASIGHPEVQLPANLHGATLVVNIPSGVMAGYPATNGQDTGLMIGQAGELTIGVEGNATLEDVRNFALSLPGDDNLTRQLRAIENWQNTLPIPVPVDEVAWQQTSIGGGQGLILADNTGVGSGAIWQRDGRVFGVAGAFKAEEIRRVADSLR